MTFAANVTNLLHLQQIRILKIRSNVSVAMDWACKYVGIIKILSHLCKKFNSKSICCICCKSAAFCSKFFILQLRNRPSAIQHTKTPLFSDSNVFFKI